MIAMEKINRERGPPSFGREDDLGAISGTVHRNPAGKSPVRQSLTRIGKRALRCRRVTGVRSANRIFNRLI